MIIVKEETKVKKQCVLGLQFCRVTKVVEKYCEIVHSSLYKICCGIGHKKMESCENLQIKCIIYSSPHKVEEYYCRVIGCKKDNGKIYVYIKIIYINYRGNHQPNSLCCILRYKVNVIACKKKMLKQSNRQK